MRNIQLMSDGKGNERTLVSSVVSNDYDVSTNINKPD